MADTKQINYIYKSTYVTVFIDGRPETVTRDHVNYDAIIKALQNEEWDKVPILISRKKAIERAVETVSGMKSNVEIRDNAIFYKGKEIGGGLVRRILEMQKNGWNIDRFVKFLENLLQNPSSSAVQELWEFMEKNDLPVSDDGCLYAYKKVRSDFKDLYTGTMDNSPGTTLYVERNEVDDNRANECSFGLHFCSYSYLNVYGVHTDSSNKVVMVKINPKDVVSFPKDYNLAKGRCTGYYVEKEIKDWKTENVLTQKYVMDMEEDEYDGDLEDDEEDSLGWDTDEVSNISTTKLLNSSLDALCRNKYSALNTTKAPAASDLPTSKEHLELRSTKEMVSIYNDLTGSNILKFRDRATAIARTWKAIEQQKS